MTNSSAANIPIYPQYCFGAAPSFNVCCFLRSADIVALRRYNGFPDLHFYKNLPIRWIRVVGVIVAIDDYPQRRVYTIDDSSGVNICCLLALEKPPAATRDNLAPRSPVPPEYEDLDVGHVVDVKGTICPYQRQRGIKIRRMKHIVGTHDELLLWEKRVSFRKTILDRPWSLSTEEVERHRQQAERADVDDFKLGSKRRKLAHAPVEGAEDPYRLKKRPSKAPGPRSSKSQRSKSGAAPEDSTKDWASAPRLPRVNELRKEERGSSRLKQEKSAVSTATSAAHDPYRLKAKKRSASTAPAVARQTSADAHQRDDASDAYKIVKKNKSLPHDELTSGSSRSVAETAEPSDPYKLTTRRKHGSHGHVTKITPAVPSRKSQPPGDDQDPDSLKSRWAQHPAPTTKQPSCSLDAYKITKRTPRARASVYPSPDAKSGRQRGGDDAGDPYSLRTPLKSSQEKLPSRMQPDVDDPFKLRKGRARPRTVAPPQ